MIKFMSFHEIHGGVMFLLYVTRALIGTVISKPPNRGQRESIRGKEIISDVVIQ